MEVATWQLRERRTSSGRRSTFVWIKLGYSMLSSQMQKSEVLCIGGHIDHADDIELGAQKSLVADGLARLRAGLVAAPVSAPLLSRSLVRASPPC